MKKVVAFSVLVIASLISCQAQASLFTQESQNAGLIKGQLDGNRYTSPSKELTVTVPSLDGVEISELNDKTGHIFNVGFTSEHYAGNGDEYAIDVVKGLSNLKVINATLENTFKSINANMNIEGCHYTSVAGNRAYQCVAKGDISGNPTITVATSMLIRGKMVNVFGTETLDNARESFNYNRYDAFMNSIQVD